jgi:N-formylglutamate amidohydrolase
MELFNIIKGSSPLILSIPHSGVHIPSVLSVKMTKAARAVPDTDWYIPKLYFDFLKKHDATVLKANYSRYVVDLNRPADNHDLYPGQPKLGVCPDKTFDGKAIYQAPEFLSDEEISTRISKYWQPYHDELTAQIERVKAIHGYAILYDAHSIRSEVPALFKGVLPELNLGTNNTASCAPGLEKSIEDWLAKKDYSYAVNGRFIGGYITRHYGCPAENVHAMQMEISTATYMDESKIKYDNSKASALGKDLTGMLTEALYWGEKTYAPSTTRPEQGFRPK